MDKLFHEIRKRATDNLRSVEWNGNRLGEILHPELLHETAEAIAKAATEEQAEFAEDYRGDEDTFISTATYEQVCKVAGIAYQPARDKRGPLHDRLSDDLTTRFHEAVRTELKSAAKHARNAYLGNA
jgi:hypothetical protein